MSNVIILIQALTSYINKINIRTLKSETQKINIFYSYKMQILNVVRMSNFFLINRKMKIIFNFKINDLTDFLFWITLLSKIVTSKYVPKSNPLKMLLTILNAMDIQNT